MEKIVKTDDGYQYFNGFFWETIDKARLLRMIDQYKDRPLQSEEDFYGDDFANFTKPEHDTHVAVLQFLKKHPRL